MTNTVSVDWERPYPRLLARVTVLEATVQALTAETQSLRAENQSLRAENQALKDKLNANSKNSSTPPSQDPFRARRHGNPSPRKRGGQPGHPGHHRAFVAVDKVNQVIDVGPLLCPCCNGSNFDTDSVKIERRQVTDLPEMQPNITQYHIHTRRCRTCGKRVRARTPAEAERSFGPRAHGLFDYVSRGRAAWEKKNLYRHGTPRD